MFKKALHRIVVIWCLYGLVRVLMFVHPHLLWCFAKVDPAFKNDSDGPYIMWVATVFGLFFLFLLGLLIHAFSNWFFNTK